MNKDEWLYAVSKIEKLGYSIEYWPDRLEWDIVDCFSSRVVWRSFRTEQWVSVRTLERLFKYLKLRRNVINKIKGVIDYGKSKTRNIFKQDRK